MERCIGAFRNSFTLQSDKKSVAVALVVDCFDDDAAVVVAGGGNGIDGVWEPARGDLGRDFVEKESAVREIMNNAGGRGQIAWSEVLTEELFNDVAAAGEP